MTNKEKLDKLRQERVGETRANRRGTTMKLVEYNNSANVIVEFQDKYNYRTRASYRDFTLGKVDNPYDKTLFGVGYRGVGNFGAFSHDKKVYNIWESVLARCYSSDTNRTKPCYQECTVCEEWHNFQNFAKWYEENYYAVDGQIMQIDKDILKKNNTIYSPETCMIVPNEINALMVKRKNQRGDCPIGVYYDRIGNKFVAACWTGGKDKEYLGRYNSSTEAFYMYKKRKEEYIKEIADKYKGKIPQKLYDALYKYEVEITD